MAVVKVYLETFGCTLNKFDSQAMISYILEEGFKLTDDPNDSDVIVLNTCGVKKQTEDKIISYIKKLGRVLDGRPIIVSGCLPLINYKRLTSECRLDGILGPSPGRYIVDAIKNVLEGEYYEKLRIDEPSIPLSLGREVSTPIAVSFGCLDNCSFCGTKNARGSVKSLDVEQVEKLVRKAIKNGSKEILLTSVDLGAYGYDLRPRRTIVDLVKRLKKIEGDFVIRLGMMNPRWVYKYLDDLIEIFTDNGKIYHFIHIPVQSGSDKLLRIMNRGHGTTEYLESVERLRREVGDHFTVMTDIIVGHPGESDDDFDLTISLLRESKPDYVNISQFFPRPNTKAALMKKVPTNVVKERSRIVTRESDIIMYERNKMWSGWKGPVLINEYGRGRYLGRNYAYKIFAVDSGEPILGKYIEVKAVRVYTTWLYAEPLKESSSLFVLN